MRKLEHDLLGDEPLSTANTPGPLRKFGLQGDALQSRDFTLAWTPCWRRRGCRRGDGARPHGHLTLP